MKRIEYSKSKGVPRGTMDEDFLTHKNCSEWWYATGFVGEEEKNLFGFQYTLAKVTIKGIKMHMMITCVTDFQTGKHYNTQTPVLFKRGITTNSETLALGKDAVMTFKPNKHGSKGTITLHMKNKDFCIDMKMEAVKPPVWHCDDGILVMGLPDVDFAKSYYFSYTNLATTGSITIHGKTYDNLNGKTWFDRQGGTYDLLDRRGAWEWFSLRFFDDHEVMLFTFPRTGYQDGTYIEKDGTYRRLNDYEVEVTSFIEYDNLKFSNSWDLKIGDQEYKIVPKVDGMYNLFFFELLADVLDKDGKTVGYGFVELMRSARNDHTDRSVAFKKKAK